MHNFFKKPTKNLQHFFYRNKKGIDNFLGWENLFNPNKYVGILSNLFLDVQNSIEVQMD
jgi:hypothetical protein